MPFLHIKYTTLAITRQENLLDFVTILQEELIALKVLPADYDFEAHKELVPMQQGDVPVTTTALPHLLSMILNFRPSTLLRDGLSVRRVVCKIL